jgi:beta-lactamase regulating signal transducer with metallopeptidase domain/tetratricopeptide (TPR) repeat protein
MDATVTAVFRFALDVSLKATLLFGVTGLVLLAMRRRPASARHFVGTLGFSAALLFPLLSSVLPRLEVPLLTPPTAAAAADAALVELGAVAAPADVAVESEAPAPDRDENAAATVAPALDASDEPSVAEVAPVTIEPAAPAFTLPLSAMAAALVLWTLGALALLARLAVGLLRVRRFRRTATPVADPEWRALVASLQPVAGARRPIHLLWSDAIPVAVTSGLRRPALLLPSAAAHWDPPRRRVVVLHELAHVARRDWPALLLAEVAAAVYWFHPLAWILERRLRRDAERAADDRVLGAGTKPSVYAGHLLGIIRALRPDARRLLPAMGMARPSHFEERLRAILDPGMRRRSLSAGEARTAAVLFVAAAAAAAVLQPWASRCAQAALPSDAPELEEPDRAVAVSRSEQPSAQCASPSKDPAEAPAGQPSPDRSLEGVRRAAAETNLELDPVAPAGTAELVNSVNVLEPLKEPSGLVLAGKREKKGGKSGDAYRRAAELHEEGRYAEAIAEFEKSFQLGYKPGASAYNAACGQARLHRNDEAFAWLDKAAENGFHDLLKYLDRDEDLESLRDDPRLPELRRRVREAEAIARQGEIEELLSEFEGLASRFPEGAERLYPLGKELLDTHQYRVAAQAFRLSAKAGYRAGASLYNTACALALDGQDSAALDALREALDAGFDDPELMRRDGDLDSIRALPPYRDLLAMADALNLHPLGIEGKEGKDDAAAEARAGWARAAARYETYAGAHPNLGRAWFNLGYARLAAGQAPAAAQAFEKSLALGYREPTTMYNLACSYARMGRTEEAFDLLFRSLESGGIEGSHLRHDGDLESLRSDPRFRKALKIAEKTHTDS